MIDGQVRLIEHNEMVTFEGFEAVWVAFVRLLKSWNLRVLTTFLPHRVTEPMLESRPKPTFFESPGSVSRWNSYHF